MRRTVKKLGLQLLLAAAALSFGVSDAFAQADEAAQTMVEAGYEQIRSRKYNDAVDILKEAQGICRKDGCSAAVEAEVYMAQGLALAVNKDSSEDEARKRFEWALAKKRDIEPGEKWVTRRVKSIFAAAKENVEAGKGAQPPAPAGQAVSAEQKELLADARTSFDSSDPKGWETCVATLLSAEEFPEGKLLLAKCYQKGGLLIEAKGEAESARDLAKQDEKEELVAEIDKYLEVVENETPKIKIIGVKKVGIAEPSAKVDAQEIPEAKLDEPIAHNPGKARITILGKRGCWKFRYTQEVSFERNETLEFDLGKIKSLPKPYELCREDAKTPADETLCRQICGVPDEDLNFKAGLEVASYNDNDNVDVFSPALYLAADHPTQGWNLGGSAIVDVVTTASADIVATASRRFDEVRFAASGAAGYKIGGEETPPIRIGVNAAMSYEADYVGRGVGANISADLFEKMATPYVSYGFGFDILGRADTEFDIFSRDLFRHTINAGTSLIFNDSTVGVIAGTVQLEDGDSSKPYRHVAMFSPEFENNLPRGATPELVARARRDFAPLEHLPTSRERFGLTLSGLHRFETATLRLSERLYTDTWGQMASTTDLRFFYDAADWVRLGPHARFHVQGPVDFWRRTYVAESCAVATAPCAGPYRTPEFFTGDRELGPLFGVTAGIGVRLQVAPVLALGTTIEGTYSQYLDHLYIFDRLGLFTATTAEVEIQ